MKKYLAMYYSDKRDVRTLECQITTSTQRGNSIQQFYQYLALILNKIYCLELTEKAVITTPTAYSSKTLDTFVNKFHINSSPIRIDLTKPITPNLPIIHTVMTNRIIRSTKQDHLINNLLDLADPNELNKILIDSKATQQPFFSKPDLMEVDNSAEFIQNNNHQNF